MDATTTASLTAAVAALGIYLNAYETARAPAGVWRFFSRAMVSEVYGAGSRVRRAASSAGPSELTLVVVVQAAAATLVPVCLLAGARPLAALFAAVVLGAVLVLFARFPYGFSGADQMQAVVWGGLLAFTLSGTALGEQIALGFIAAQAVLAYVTAGASKLFSSRPHWRRGTAILDVMRTDTYGIPRVAEWRWATPASVALSWGTMAFEILGPFSIVFGPRVAIWFVGFAVIFHIGIALAMGLTNFVFAFGAALPSVYWASGLIGAWLWGS